MFLYRSQLLGSIDQAARLPLLAASQPFFFKGFKDRSLALFKKPLDFPESADFTVPQLKDVRRESHGQIFSFTSPAAQFLPEESRQGYFELTFVEDGNYAGPWAIILAATGDEDLATRKKGMAEPLKRRGINSLVLQIPFYGRRRVALQQSYALPFVEDCASQALGCCTEAVGALYYLKERGGQEFVFCGQSYGASMAAFASSICTEDHYVVAACPASGPRDPFVEGILAGRVAPIVDKQLLDEALSLIDLRKNKITEPNRRMQFIFATHDAFVSRGDTKKLIQTFAAVPKTSISETEVNGGHATTLLARKGLFVDKIAEILM